MTWKLFEKKQRSPYRKFEDAMIIIVTDNSILLTPKSYAAIGSPAFVHLLSDEAGRIGIRAAKDDDPNAFVIRPSRLSMVKINCKAFLISAVPSHQETVYYEAWVEGDVLIADTKGDVEAFK